jgi:hypothetical protein
MLPGRAGRLEPLIGLDVLLVLDIGIVAGAFRLFRR